jgi:hypothetical protein
MKDTRNVREAGFACMAYFYFDFNDTPMQDNLPFSMIAEVLGDVRTSGFKSTKYTYQC